MNERGAIPIIIALFMLSGAVAISLSVATVRTTRIQLARQDTVVSETEQQARAKREEIIFSIDSDTADIADVYLNGGDGQGNKTDCAAGDWQRDEEIEYCIESIDGYTFQLRTRLLQYDIVRQTEFTVPDSCVPSGLSYGYGHTDCPTQLTKNTIGVPPFFFINIYTCQAPQSWGSDYYYNTGLPDGSLCNPGDCEGRKGGGPVVAIASPFGSVSFSWRMYQCGSDYTFDNSVFSGNSCEYCPFGVTEQSIQGHPVIPDGTYKTCTLPKYWKTPRYTSPDVYAQSFDGPVCLSQVPHGYQGAYGEGTPFCQENCNVSWTMWDEEFESTGQRTMYAAQYVADNPTTPLCSGGFDPAEVYGSDESGVKNAANSSCAVGAASCRAIDADCTERECQELRFSCVPNIPRNERQQLKWAKYYDATCSSADNCGLDNCVAGFGMKEHQPCDASLENFSCFKEYIRKKQKYSVILQCTREKNGWTIVRVNETVNDNPQFSPTRQEGGETIWNTIVCGGFTDQEWGYRDINSNGELLPAVCPDRFSCVDPLGDFEDGNTDTLVRVDCRDVNPCTDDRPVYNRLYSECCPIGIDPAYVGTVDPEDRPETNCVPITDLPPV